LQVRQSAAAGEQHHLVSGSQQLAGVHTANNAGTYDENPHWLLPTCTLKLWRLTAGVSAL